MHCQMGLTPCMWQFRNDITETMLLYHSYPSWLRKRLSQLKLPFQLKKSACKWEQCCGKQPLHCASVPQEESFWLHYREKMIPWLAPGLLKGVYMALLYTSTNALTKTHKHTQQNSTSLMHLTEQGRSRLGASSALLPMCSLSHSSSTRMYNCPCPPFLQTGGLVVKTRRMSGLPSNAVLMVACVAGREGMLQLMEVFFLMKVSLCWVYQIWLTWARMCVHVLKNIEKNNLMLKLFHLVLIEKQYLQSCKVIFSTLRFSVMLFPPILKTGAHWIYKIVISFFKVAKVVKVINWSLKALYSHRFQHV